MEADEGYDFNWDTEMLRHRRVLKKGGQRELAEPHVAESGDRDHQLAQARRLGGMVREIRRTIEAARQAGAEINEPRGGVVW